MMTAVRKRNPDSATSKSQNNYGIALNSIPCAIYTRKSSEEGLEQNFNSLDAQREACEAYVLSQKAEGWKALPIMYDDGGFTGGNMARPGLKKLMTDIEAKKIKIVVVYKVDRLTRSLADFAKMVELFDEYGVSFVSITQQFNTTSSMGRLTLNVLLSFAQFEREVTGERIRDKIAASKAKGMWMGGIPPIGYKVKNKTLIVDESSAELVREIYQGYLALGNVRLLKEDLARRERKTPKRISRRNGQSGGLPFSRGHLYRILSNPIYIGQVAHRENTYPGQHLAIIDRTVWDAVQIKIIENHNGNKTKCFAANSGLLAGLVYGNDGEPLLSIHSRKKLKTHKSATYNTAGYKQYRYYVSRKLLVGIKEHAQQAMRIPAEELELAVIGRIVAFLKDGVGLLKVTEEHGLDDTTATHAVLNSAHKIAQLLESPEKPSYESDTIRLLNNLVSKVIVRTHEIEINLTLGFLIRQSKATSHASVDAWTGFDWNNLVHTIILPVTLQRTGLAMKVIIDAPEHRIARKVDAKMVKALCRAYQWLGQLTTGKVRSMQDIAIKEQLEGTYISPIIQLAFLAPDITKAILTGTQPETLTLAKLMKSIPIPIDWKEQRRLLGFD